MRGVRTRSFARGQSNGDETETEEKGPGGKVAHGMLRRTRPTCIKAKPGADSPSTDNYGFGARRVCSLLDPDQIDPRLEVRAQMDDRESVGRVIVPVAGDPAAGQVERIDRERRALRQCQCYTQSIVAGGIGSHAEQRERWHGRNGDGSL